MPFNVKTTGLNTGTAATPYDPTSVSNLVAWWTNNRGVTQSGTVSAWANQASTGATYNASQGTGANQPTFSTSLIYGDAYGMTFDGTNDSLTVASDIVLSGDFTIIMMAAPTLGNNQCTYFGHGTGTGKIAASSYINTTFTNDAASSATITAHAPMDAYEHTITFTRSGSTITRYVDGIVDGTATLSGTITLNRIGSHSTGGTSNSYVGKLFEICIYSAALSTTNRKAVEDYYRQKYSVGQKILVFAMASLTRGDGNASVNPANGYPAQIIGLIRAAGYKGYVAFNDGISGMALVAGGTRAATATTGIDNKDYYSKPFLICQDAGANDVSGVPGSPNTATVMSRSVTYFTARNATGVYRYIFAATFVPRVNTDYWNNGQPVNAEIRAQMLPGGTLKTAGVTAYTDPTTNAAFDADGDYNNTTYYQGDKVHLTAAGATILANMHYATIAPYLY